MTANKLIHKLKLGQLFVRLSLALLTILMLYPMIFMLITSLKSNPEYYSNFWGLPHELH